MEKVYSEIEVSEEVKDPILQALIKSYQDHIETLKKRIQELEPLKREVAPIRTIPINNKPVLRTTAAMIAELERRSKLDFEKEVTYEEVK